MTPTNKKIAYTLLAIFNLMLVAGIANADAQTKNNNNIKGDKKPLGATQSTYSQDADEIIVITWNIKWYPGGNPFSTKKDRAEQKKTVAEEMAHLDPTILVAQEIRDWESFYELCQYQSNPINSNTEKIDENDPEKSLRPLTVSFFPQNMEGEYWPQQVAIASKLKTIAAWSQMWQTSKSGIQPRRGFAVAAILLPKTNYLLLVYSIHLKSNREDENIDKEDITAMREESARQILDHSNYLTNTLFKNRVAGIIVSGDLNTNSDGNFEDKTIQILKDGGFHHTWENTPISQRITWVGNKTHKEATLDHVFTKYLDKPQTTVIEINPKNTKEPTKQLDTKVDNQVNQNQGKPDPASDHVPLRTVIRNENYQVSIAILDFLESINDAQKLKIKTDISKKE